MSAESPQITARRQLKVERLGGTVTWTVSEFEHGGDYILVANAVVASVQFQAHFDREQWAEFQALVAGSTT